MYMENVKEHYWRYSLITIILGLGVILFFKITRGCKLNCVSKE